MTTKYDPKKIERKWQKFWEKNKIFEVKEDRKKQKFYSLIEFPYPSAAGLHVGHPRPFTAMDVISRQKRMAGFNVLYPIGFDAFGLPTENYAIKTGRPPAEVTKENIATFTRQLKSLGYSFDWSRVVDTTDPKYYKWTQWIFLQFFKHGLAYKKNQPINWCPKDKIGLANEEVVNGCCERCGTPVEKRNKEQWMLAITKYADKLLEGLKEVDYIPAARIQQENWIGKSEGAEIKFQISDFRFQIEVFTTRPDTLFGATYLVLAPEHKIIADLRLQIANLKEVEKYLEQVKKKSDQERTAENREKTGVELQGVKAINPATNEEIPVWIADYVLASYGTGAIMAVPAHDERDWEFAKKFGLPIKIVVCPHYPSKICPILTEAFTGVGHNIDSGFLDGLSTVEAKEKMIQWLEEHKVGKRQVNYKLRDWVFSRQRYWGEPIPLVFCESCKNRKQKILLIHGFTGRADKNWLPWMKKELEKQDFEVFAPTMTTWDKPVLEKWIAELMPFVDKLGENDVIVGHSLGGKAALHILERINKKIGHVYLVAPVITSITDSELQTKKNKRPEKDYFSTKAFWNAPLNWKKIKAHAIAGNVIFSDDDPSVPYIGHKIIPANWHIQKLSGYEHFTDTEIPELLANFLQSKSTGWVPLPESELPLKLPKVEKYQPTDTGESPLAAMDKWVMTKCPRCGGEARRETDTMPNWAGSSWYYLAYVMQGISNFQFPISNYQDAFKYWLPVDWYNGGMEHTVLHLLYSRFWNQFMFDLGLVPTREPYQKRTSHGLILGPDGEKMSKSRGNVVNPDEMVAKFGTDTFRAYIMFMGPFDQPVQWDTHGLIGVRRFLERVWALQDKLVDGQSVAEPYLLHQTIKKVTEDIASLNFNTAISALMILVNNFYGLEKISKADLETLILLLSPFAPHLAEEIWQKLGHKKSLAFAKWPEFDERLLREEDVTIMVQINGKIREKIVLPVDTSEKEVKSKVLSLPNVQKYLQGQEPKKFIYIKNKLVSLVV